MRRRSLRPTVPDEIQDVRKLLDAIDLAAEVDPVRASAAALALFEDAERGASSKRDLNELRDTLKTRAAGYTRGGRGSARARQEKTADLRRAVADEQRNGRRRGRGLSDRAALRHIFQRDDPDWAKYGADEQDRKIRNAAQRISNHRRASA